MSYWKIAVDAPIKQLLTYRLEHDLTTGDSVKVPLGKRIVDGVLIAADPQKKFPYALKSVISHNVERPKLTTEQVSWALWLAEYYLHPPGNVFSSFFPPLKKEGRIKGSFLDEIPKIPAKKLTPEQNKVFENIFRVEGFKTHLLFGVTGSGKTEVYIKLITEQLNKGKTALVLLPEISLTPQLVRRFREQLGDTVAVLHSHLTERQRTNEWWSIMDRKKSVLIGARSSLFCPLPDLGIIIIDEEHETSYKQEEGLKYHARDTAIMRAKFSNCPIVLGSATPSVETWQNVQNQRFEVHHLNNRVTTNELPDVEIINLNEERATKTSDGPYWLSDSLKKALEDNYAKSKQSALFINRRGIAQTVLCKDCGFVYQCPNCEISLTLHGKSSLVCHYCEYDAQLNSKCPDCLSEKLKPVGLGTEQVEEDIKKSFPHASVFRVDRDVIDSRKELENFIEKMESNEIDILIGTQMIAKGLDFKRLTLVGLVLADISFNLPDFRASERAYQLLTQMSGRAGRHEKGRVIIQTYNSDHPSLTRSQKYDTSGFLNEELKFRKELNYPPFFRLACIKISSSEQKKAFTESKNITELLRKYQADRNLENMFILGPAPAPLFKIRNRYRYQVLIKAASPNALNQICKELFHWRDIAKKVTVKIDIDPYNMM